MFVALATIVLAFAVISIFFTSLLAILAWVVRAIGSASAFLMIVDRLVDHDEGWTKPLLVGAGINDS